jgi:aminoglycoside phosphotransferase (APT) family kinase protein
VDLGEWLAGVLGGPVADLRQLTGGASRETWTFSAGSRRLVLRRDPPGSVVAAGRGGMAVEAAALAAAAVAGVPVPVLVSSGPGFVITEFVPGETIPRRLLRDPAYAGARAGMAVSLGRTLARVHAIPVSSVPGLPSGDPLSLLRADCDAVGDGLPVVEIALRWLADHRPAPVAETVVHGDFRNGNLIIGPSGLRAVLDWELVHHGDPREDLGWLCVKCWRFGSSQVVGGFGPVSELLDGYASVAGWRPDEAAVTWWQVYRTAWWAIGCRAMALRHLSGETPSVELAAIGRRVCEQEHDLLLALGVPAPPNDRDGTIAVLSGSDLHGRPTAAELADAVAGFLREDVMAATSGRVNYLARVAANALGIVSRELRYGPGPEIAHRERLAALGVPDQAALAVAIRTGRISYQDPDLLSAVRAMVTDRLMVANPRYLAYPALLPRMASRNRSRCAFTSAGFSICTR